ncbi:MAG: right-handed parallel beta-helix repeat-containing protein [Saprospiraceae bacterium]|nr:right-handed parallel beta-helix repeat-containing protein [Saprospiraceae bacterium]
MKTKVFLLVILILFFIRCAGQHWLHKPNSPLGNFPDGPWIDARPYVNLWDAVKAIGSNEGNLLISKPIDIGKSPLEIPRNITLQFLQGGALTIHNEQVNISGIIEAGPWQIFNIKGKGKITLTHSLTTEVYPQWWGAIAGAGKDCSSAIQQAVDVGASYGLTVLIPSGSYLCRATVQIGVDNLKILGYPGSVIIMEDTLMVLAAHKGYPKNPPSLTYNLQIEGITIQYVKAGPTDKGAIQLNNCVDFVIENVRIIGDGKGMGGSRTNGIACAYVYSTGVFKNVIVDGMSKPGFYAAAGHDIRFEGCIGRNCKSTWENIRNAGFGISNVKNVTLLNCEAYNNDGPGLGLSPTVNDPNPSDWGSEQASPAAPCKEGGEINSYCSVQIIGGHYYKNGTHGIATGTKPTGKPTTGGRGFDIQIICVNCSDNMSNGFEIVAVQNLLLTDCIAARNNVGINVSDGVFFTSNKEDSLLDITSFVTIRGCQLIDNKRVAIGVRSTNNVSIENCRIYDSCECKHVEGIIAVKSKSSYSKKVKKNRNLRIVDVDFPSTTSPNNYIVHENNLLSAVESGYYRLQSYTIGDPNGILFAPTGSEYVDLKNGIKYRKQYGFDNQGWKVE